MSLILEDINALLDRSKSAPLYKQLYEAIRSAIKSRQLRAGDSLPSTRTFADELDISRNTVNHALDKLEAEGYINTRERYRTRVSGALPENYTQVSSHEYPIPNLRLLDTSTRPTSLSDFGRRVSEFALHNRLQPDNRLAFYPGVPAFDAFPIDTWSRLTSRRWHSLAPEQLVYGHPAGYYPLREAVSKYLRTARGVRCEADQVIIVSGVQQGTMLAAQTLIDPGDEVVVEDPGFTYMRAAFAAVGAQITPVSVDDHGLDVEELDPASAPKMVGVTPSHQFPLGVTMGLSRRLALLEYAASNDVWILEDDYDSEFRYSGEPIAALQGLDNGGRVIYTGSFSKVLFPALRLGYLVAPPDVVPHITRMRAVNDRCPPRIVQMILSDFLADGYFYEHIREMRMLYKSRQRMLIEALSEEFDSFFQVRRKDAGLHLVAWLPEGVNDQAISQTLDEADVVAPPISHFFDGDVERGALLLGFAGVNESEIWNSVEHMAQVLSKYL